MEMVVAKCWAWRGESWAGWWRKYQGNKVSGPDCQNFSLISQIHETQQLQLHCLLCRKSKWILKYPSVLICKCCYFFHLPSNIEAERKPFYLLGSCGKLRLCLLFVRNTRSRILSKIGYVEWQIINQEMSCFGKGSARLEGNWLLELFLQSGLDI